jgi:hypothetical protein
MSLKNYRTFKRTCKGWESFSKANKITDRKGLTYTEAQSRCARLNAELTPAQIKRGTKYEFTIM